MDITILHCASRGYGPRAAGLAAEIEEALGVPVKRQPGKLGQFDVVVDGQVVASRTGGLWKRVLGGGWPDPHDVIARIEAKRRGGVPG